MIDGRAVLGSEDQALTEVLEDRVGGEPVLDREEKRGNALHGDDAHATTGSRFVPEVRVGDGVDDGLVLVADERNLSLLVPLRPSASLTHQTHEAELDQHVGVPRTFLAELRHGKVDEIDQTLVDQSGQIGFVLALATTERIHHVGVAEGRKHLGDRRVHV